MSYITAERAAEILGVTRATLYAYVSRRGIRSVPVEGTRQRLYWESDVRDARRPPGRPRRDATTAQVESSVSLIDGDRLYFRGEDAIALSEWATLEDVAERLWQAQARTVTACLPVELPSAARTMLEATASRSGIERAATVLGLVEADSPRAFDLSAGGMAASGAEAVRMLAAILLRRNELGKGPLHVLVARHLDLPPVWEDVIRRLLVLSADHGLEPVTLAVRAMAGVGITPYRAIAGGLLVLGGRQSILTRAEHIRDLFGEIQTRGVRPTMIERLRREGGIPGFGSDLYAAGDPRARALWDVLAPLCDRDPELHALRDAVAFVREELGQEPSFALFVHAVTQRVMPDRRDTLFALGRSVGWVAHAIERYCAGEQKRAAGHYSGPLPGDR